MKDWIKISKYHRTSIVLIVVAIVVRMILHLMTYSTFVPEFSYVGNDLSVILGVIFYLFLFVLLMMGILRQNKLIKIYAIFLTMISFLGLFLGNLEDWSLIDYLWVMHFVLLFMATIMLFSRSRS